MKHKSVLFGLLAVLALLILSACTGKQIPPAQPEPTAATEEHDDGDEHAAEPEEHVEGDEHEHVEIPQTYEEMNNPFAGDAAAAEAGQVLYQANCASCHGATGQGDGPASTALYPRPANLADADMMADLSDGYIFWRISEGGMMEPFNSQMPPWKGTLSEEEIWQVITYMRTLGQGE